MLSTASCYSQRGRFYRQSLSTICHHKLVWIVWISVSNNLISLMTFIASNYIKVHCCYEILLDMAIIVITWLFAYAERDMWWVFCSFFGSMGWVINWCYTTVVIISLDRSSHHITTAIAWSAINSKIIWHYTRDTRSKSSRPLELRY